VTTTEEAYAQCEQITWSQARNFAYGIRLLTPDKRRGLAAVYAFARRIDDIGDGTLPPDEKIRQLEAARQSIGGDPGDDPVLIALADAGKRFAIPLGAFGELVDGCVADVRGTTYQTWDELYHYCRCVAGSIGRLSLAVFAGSPPMSRGGLGGIVPPEAIQMADDLGIALQLTNILRDVREDYQNGRVYLPAEDLARFGLELIPGSSAEPFPDPTQQARFASLVEFEADRAREWYDRGLPLLKTLDRRSAACTGAMAGIYRRLLERIARRPSAVLEGRQSLPPAQKLLVAVQSLTNPRHVPRPAGGAPRRPVQPASASARPSGEVPE
jgi:15-cis-phytoene synthase